MSVLGCSSGPVESGSVVHRDGKGQVHEPDSGDNVDQSQHALEEPESNGHEEIRDVDARYPVPRPKKPRARGGKWDAAKVTSA